MSEKLDLADFLQRFSTKVLWHFTGYNKDDDVSYEILKQIISSRTLKINTHPEDIIMPDGEKRGCFPYSCMCDIPLKDLRIHTIRYGNYGIAFDKHAAIILGHFNPVLYLHKDHYYFLHANKLLKEIDNEIEKYPELDKKITQYFSMIGAYIKKSDLTSSIVVENKVKDKDQSNNFYYEREWRSPANWQFTESDIEAIMVPKYRIGHLKDFLSTHNIIDVTVISHEMITKL